MLHPWSGAFPKKGRISSWWFWKWLDAEWEFASATGMGFTENLEYKHRSTGICRVDDMLFISGKYDNRQIISLSSKNTEGFHLAWMAAVRQYVLESFSILIPAGCTVSLYPVPCTMSMKSLCFPNALLRFVIIRYRRDLTVSKGNSFHFSILFLISS